MRTKRLYQITRTFLHYGLNELIPARWMPWSVRLARYSLFWLPNRHKDKPAGLRLRLALESLGRSGLNLARCSLPDVTCCRQISRWN